MPTKNEEILSLSLISYIEKVRQDFIRQNVNATGRTAKALRQEVSNEIGRVYGPEYIGTLEEGKGPGEMPLVSSIQQWITAKKLPLNAWAVAKSIELKGTLLHRGILPPGRTERNILSKRFSEIRDSLRTQIVITNGERLRTEVLQKFKGIAR